MDVLEEVILEETNKTWYACISSKIWGSIWGSSVTSGGIPWGIINRQTSAVASPGLKESVIRWIKHNNFIKHVHIDGNTITVDGDWWSKEKNTEVIILKAPEGSTFKGVFSDRNIGSPYIQHGGLVMGGGNPFMSKKMKDEFAKETGIKSSTMTIESAIKKAGLKIKTDDTGVDITGPINAFKKFNGWESLDMYTEREVRELLEQAFSEGYDNGIDDTLDYIDENYELESSDFDLMDEYGYYTEDAHARYGYSEKSRTGRAVDRTADKVQQAQDSYDRLMNKKMVGDRFNIEKYKRAREELINKNNRIRSARRHNRDAAGKYVNYINKQAALKEDSFDLMDEYESFMEMDQKYKDEYKANIKFSERNGNKVSDSVKRNLAKHYAAKDLYQKMFKKIPTSIKGSSDEDIQEKFNTVHSARKKAYNVAAKAANYMSQASKERINDLKKKIYEH